MIIILNLWGGLCNQICDLYYSINYFIDLNIKYSLKCCAFRDNSNLEKFYFKKYDELFNKNFLDLHKNYINFEKIKNRINNKNKIFISKKDININLLNEYLNKYKNKEVYIFIEGFYKLNINIKKIYVNFNSFINPNNKILKIYNFIKNTILKEKYNYIHLRFEKDFENIFGSKNIINFNIILNKIKFKKNHKIYLACSNTNKILKNKNKNNYLFKDDLISNFNLNFEEKAFIDFLIGIYSEEFYGNSKSSFSLLLSIIKKTKNFYN